MKITKMYCDSCGDEIIIGEEFYEITTLKQKGNHMTNIYFPYEEFKKYYCVDCFKILNKSLSC